MPHADERSDLRRLAGAVTLVVLGVVALGGAVGAQSRIPFDPVIEKLDQILALLSPPAVAREIRLHAGPVRAKEDDTVWCVATNLTTAALRVDFRGVGQNGSTVLSGFAVVQPGAIGGTGVGSQGGFYRCEMWYTGFPGDVRAMLNVEDDLTDEAVSVAIAY